MLKHHKSFKNDLKVEDEVRIDKLYKIIIKQLSPMDHAPVNIYELKNYCYYGYVNDDIRPLYWKLFLGYSTKNKFKLESFLKERRKLYKFYYENAEKEKEKDPNIDNIINNDVDRTMIHPLTVGAEDGVTFKKCKFLDVINKSPEKSTINRDALKRILLTFKVTNSSLGYVQGMNMVLVPIYYVFCNSKNEEDRKYAEEDAYFCFFNLMTEIGENFMEDMDYDKHLGIRWKMNEVFEIVKKIDEDLYNNLQSKKLNENFFHFRWISLLLAQEFKIEEVIWLWDKLLSDISRFEMVIYCSAAIILLLKEFIEKNDFEACMEAFQEVNKDGVESVFYKADEVRRTLNKK